jgi:ABC-type nitrate/sulfonate/bicarbonate transport system substrate-binding protein
MRSRRIVSLGWLLLAVAIVAATGDEVPAQSPAVKIGYIPSDSFAALYIMADRYLIPDGINAQMVRLPGGAEITPQVATGQLQMGGAGMDAAGFNAVAAKLPIEFIAPPHMGYLEDYCTVRKAVWGSQVKRIGDLKGRPVALNTRGAAVEWMLDQVLRRDGLIIKDVQVKIMPISWSTIHPGGTRWPRSLRWCSS